MDWQAPTNQLELGKKLARDYKIRSVELLTSCSTCHR
jgi:cytochrome c553